MEKKLEKWQPQIISQSLHFQLHYMYMCVCVYIYIYIYICIYLYISLAKGHGIHDHLGTGETLSSA